jgi:hypothetical protein
MRLIVSVALLMMPVYASAQELEPGAYWPIPKGLNILSIVSSVNWGDVTFDPALPADDATATINTTALAVTRALSVAGRSVNIGIVLPIVGGHLKGVYLGEFTEVDRFGLGDPRFRFAMNLYGAPSMTPQQFGSYRLRSIVGVSITVLPPLGQYDSTRLVNLGSNRWSFKPDIGISRAFGKWVLEFMGGAWFFTDNTDFAGGRTREQDPILSTQVHFTYRFTPVMWLAADANFYAGGRTTLAGRRNLDLQRNSRIGATFSKSLTRGHAIRASVSQGAYTTIGGNFTSAAVSYNYAWVHQSREVAAFRDRPASAATGRPE